MAAEKVPEIPITEAKRRELARIEDARVGHLGYFDIATVEEIRRINPNMLRRWVLVDHQRLWIDIAIKEAAEAVEKENKRLSDLRMQEAKERQDKELEAAEARRRQPFLFIRPGKRPA